LFAASVYYTSGVVDTVGNLPLESLTPVANLPLVSLTPLVSTTRAKLVAKFATGVIDTGGATLTCEYLRKFSKN
jgi:hypothetical protein